MRMHIKIFPIAGLCDQQQELELSLEVGCMSELETLLQKRLSADLRKIEELMFLHNGYRLDKNEDVVFQDGDQLWLLPQISGG